MKVVGKQEVEVIKDIQCDVCGDSTSGNDSHSPQYGALQANWGYGSKHDGEVYEVHLCELCFFQALADLKQHRRSHMMFAEDGYEPNAEFGLVKHSSELI
ncbi:hypothetical protein ACT7PP_003087 [Vibrio cholerae]|uniref:hypothetical protein n=1 Tax=Providencia stuartii TaxID=588 RepID=UPI002988AB6C|nr:hypothetical protein [Vibrio cholerae]HEG4439374.1 hypothetical protein [Vibrio cholerae]